MTREQEEQIRAVLNDVAVTHCSEYRVKRKRIDGALQEIIDIIEFNDTPSEGGEG